MKRLAIVAAVIGVFLLIALGGGCTAYNNMVENEVSVDKAWANVQSAYQRRLDLIPNLVETVKGYAKHESTTMTDVTAQRTGNLAPDVAKAEGELMDAQKSMGSFGGPNSQGATEADMQKLDNAYRIYINAVHEAYPDLKANQNFMDLQKQLEGTENRINTERVRYNDAVKEYNVLIRRFPTNMFANMFGFTQKNMFEADEGAQNAPKVSFD